MDKIKVYDNKAFADFEFVSFEDILNNFDNYNISKIVLSDNDIQFNTVFIVNNKDNPVSCTSLMGLCKCLYINPEYYDNNANLVDSFIIEFIKKYSGSLNIASTKLINNNVIKTISNNKNIDEVYLGSSEDIYLLKEDDYNLLKNGTIKKIITYGVDEKLKNNYDSIIGYNRDLEIVGYYSYDMLMSFKDNDIITINSPLTDEQIKYFSLLKNVVICFDYDDYNNILDTIQKLDKINSNFKYKFEVNNKISFNKELLSRDNIPNNIIVNYDRLNLNINNYLENEKMLYEMIKPAINLSDYEKFLYAYNIVKHFKKYKESSDDKSESRKLHRIINNEYMVCVGFSEMLIDLLTKLGINATAYDISVDSGFDKVNVKDEIIDDVMSKRENHARVLVHLVDSKYGINGIYQSDPTWDNVLGSDSYIYSLMTFTEAQHAKRYLYDDKTVYNLLSAKTINDFYNKVNNYMDYLIKDKESAIKIDEAKARMRVVEDILALIKKIDNKYYQELITKYNQISNQEYKIYFKDFLYDVGNYFISKCNNPINLEQLKCGVKTLYSSFYMLSKDEVNKEVDRMIEFNKDRMDNYFPTSYKINQDGTREIYSFLENKFDSKIVK